MSSAYIIEVEDEATGIVVLEKDGYRFFSATSRFNQADGRIFSSPRKATRALTELAARQIKPARLRARNSH